MIVKPPGGKSKRIRSRQRTCPGRRSSAMMLPAHLVERHPMPVVNFGKMLTACHDSMRGREEPRAFVHRVTGEVMFVKPGDPVAAKWFPGLDLNKLLAAVAKSPDWLAVPKHNGPPKDLAGFVREWCEGNGFRTD